jgi:predicted PurR-regulated permease PerM
MHLVNAKLGVAAVLIGALLGGLLAGWIGIPFGAVILTLVVVAATAVRRQRQRARTT